MAALDFPNAPINGTTYTAPNGAVYTYDGTAWTVSGVLSTGTAAGGDLSGTYPNPSVAAGAVTWAKTALQSYARLTKTSNTAVANVTSVVVPWDTAETNVGGLFSAGQPTRLTNVDAGFYVFGATLGFASSTAGSLRRVILQANGATLFAIQDVPPSAYGYVTISVTAAHLLTAATYLEVLANQNSGATINVGGNEWGMPASFWMARVA